MSHHESTGAVARYLKAAASLVLPERAEPAEDDGRGPVARYLRIGEGSPRPAAKPKPPKAVQPKKAEPKKAEPKKAQAAKADRVFVEPKQERVRAPKEEPVRKEAPPKVEPETTLCPDCDLEIAPNTDQCPHCALFLPRAA